MSRSPYPDDAGIGIAAGMARGSGEGEAWHRLLSEALLDGFVQTDAKGRLQEFNEVFRGMVGRSTEELRSLTLWDLALPRWQEVDIEALLSHVAARGHSDTFEMEYHRRGGGVVPVELRLHGLRDAEGRLTGLSAIVRDISERRRIAVELEQRVQELAVLNRIGRRLGASLSADVVVRTTLAETAEVLQADMVLVLVKEDDGLRLRGLIPADPSGSSAAPAAPRVEECLCGRAAREGRAIYSDHLARDQRCSRDECRCTGQHSLVALPLVSGSEIVGVLTIGSAEPRRFEEQASFLEALSRQIAIGLGNALLYEQTRAHAAEQQARLARIEQAEAETQQLFLQLQQAQKMEAIGTLAGGIAHDFNNILTPLLMGLELALMHLPEHHAAHPLVNDSLKAAIRAKDLVQQILTFGRQSDLERRPLRLAPLLRETVKLARAALPSTIEIQQHLDDDDCLVLANPTQMHQVVMNLVSNAGHSMRDGGILTVSLKRHDLNDQAEMPAPELAPGAYAWIQVADTGQGMSRQVMERIFHPFYTTKKHGEGIGLGLSIVHGIVRSYGGVVNVESTLGMGTTFTLYLPLSQDQPIAEGSSSGEGPLPGGTERILLVDDEPALLEILSKVLEDVGFAVRPVPDPFQALELFCASPAAFDLVITDMTMPRMTGDKLAAELLRHRPGIPIILCTGFNESICAAQARELGIADFAMKPLSMRDLIVRIRRLLDARRTVA